MHKKILNGLQNNVKTKESLSNDRQSMRTNFVVIIGAVISEI